MTGFPAGTLPDGSMSSGSGVEPMGRTVMSGDPIPPLIGPEMVGSKLNRLSVIAEHVGYNIIRLSYSPTVLDAPYTFALMSGNRRIARLYFNHSMTLVGVE
jgi:hypothetical protein